MIIDNCSTQTPIWTVRFISLCMANLALFMSMHILSPLLPLYLVEIGGSERDVGFVMSAYSIGAIIMRPLAGLWVDRTGRKKVLTLGMALALLVTSFYALAADVTLIMLVRGFHGLAFGIVSTALATIVADSLPPARLSEGIGYFGLTTSFSLALAPLVGFWLLGASGFRILFIGVIVLTAMAFCCSMLVRVPVIPLASSKSKSVKEILGGLLEKRALPASAVVFFLAMVHGSVLTYIALYATQLGLDNIGFFFTANAITTLISRPVAGRWADRGRNDLVLCLGMLALIIAMIIIVLSHTITGFLLAGILIGFGFGFCTPTLQALAVRHVPANRRGAATGTFFVAFDLGIGLGTIIWGFVAEAAGYQLMYFFTLIPLSVAAAIYYIFRTKMPQIECS